MGRLFPAQDYFRLSVPHSWLFVFAPARVEFNFSLYLIFARRSFCFTSPTNRTVLNCLLHYRIFYFALIHRPGWAISRLAKEQVLVPKRHNYYIIKRHIGKDIKRPIVIPLKKVGHTRSTCNNYTCRMRRCFEKPNISWSKRKYCHLLRRPNYSGFGGTLGVAPVIAGTSTSRCLYECIADTSARCGTVKRATANSGTLYTLMNES